jgi:hypothetical protein
MQPDQTKENKKRAYEKPRLRMIELAAEEVLAVGCKTDANPTSGTSGLGCIMTFCSAETNTS